jgi:hypothetical protein
MIGEGRLVQMESSSSGAGSGQGQVCACAWMVMEHLKETTVAVPGWCKRHETPDGEACSVGARVRHSPDVRSM